MYYTKYYSTFASVRGNVTRVEIEAPDFYGYDTELAMPPEQPVTLERAAGESPLYGLMGTVARLRFIDTEDNPIDPADFVVNAFTDLRCSIYLDNVLQFRGYIVLDDVVNEYRVKPIQVELTFSDNVAQLDEIEAPFTIDESFTNLPEIIARNLALTGLEFDLSIFFSLYPADNSSADLAEVKNIPRSWMENVSTFRKSKEMLNDILTGLRCRLFQLRGEWVMVRTFDYLQNEYPIYPGTKYAYGTFTPTATTLDCSLIDDLIPLSFAQTVTYNRARVKVQDTFPLKPLPGIWNADLQELGSLASTATVGDIKTDKYNVPFWTLQSGFANTFIVVVTNTALEIEVNRYLEIPFVNEAYNTGNAVLLNPILVSKNDAFDFNISIAADSDSNFAFNFPFAFFLAGQSGQNYVARISVFGITIFNVWDFAGAATASNFPTNNRFNFRGNIDLTEFQSIDLLSTPSNANVKADIQPFPEDGILYIKLAGFKNNDSRLADKKAYVKDLQFNYIFRLNESTLVESQKHTATIPIDSLNIDEKNIAVDDCVKYSAAGAMYDTNEANTNLWTRAVGVPATIGAINVTEQLTAEGAGRRVISGIFEGDIELCQFATFDGARFIPSRLITDYQRNQVQAVFVELAEAEPGYGFRYVYKSIE
jgi:hypothetical protein